MNATDNLKHYFYSHAKPFLDAVEPDNYKTSNFKGEIYEAYVYETLLIDELSKPNPARIMAKGPYNARGGKSFKTGFCCDFEGRLIYFSCGSSIAEFDALIFSKDEIIFYESTLSENKSHTNKLKKDIPNKKHLLSYLFPLKSIKCVVVSDKPEALDVLKNIKDLEIVAIDFPKVNIVDVAKTFKSVHNLKFENLVTFDEMNKKANHLNLAQALEFVSMDLWKNNLRGSLDAIRNEGLKFLERAYWEKLPLKDFLKFHKNKFDSMILGFDFVTIALGIKGDKLGLRYYSEFSSEAPLFELKPASGTLKKVPRRKLAKFENKIISTLLPQRSLDEFQKFELQVKEFSITQAGVSG